ncbi:MAG: hypothetical protein AAGF71_10405 [Pseudomonadota bacterium]
MSDDHIVLFPSLVRRVVACALGGMVAAMLLWHAVTQIDLMFTNRALLLGFAALSGWGAFELWRATGVGLRLTDTAICDTSGTEIALFSEVKALDRGVFALKPSNGVLITLHNRRPRRWMPGLFWCSGKRVGLGGMTPKNETKAFVDLLQMRVAKAR